MQNNYFCQYCNTIYNFDFITDPKRFMIKVDNYSCPSCSCNYYSNKFFKKYDHVFGDISCTYVNENLVPIHNILKLRPITVSIGCGSFFARIASYTETDKMIKMNIVASTVTGELLLGKYGYECLFVFNSLLHSRLEKDDSDMRVLEANNIHLTFNPKYLDINSLTDCKDDLWYLTVEMKVHENIPMTLVMFSKYLHEVLSM